MSWDVMVFAFATPPPPVEELPSDWESEVLGTAGEVQRKITERLPGVDWSDPSWGIYEGDGFSFEFNVGNEDPVDNMMIHVRGGGDAIAALLHLTSEAPWYLLDCSTGEWLHHSEDPAEGWAGFQAFRDRVLRQSQNGEVTE